MSAPPAVLLAGPPFDGALLRLVADRLGHARTESVLDGAHPAHGWRERAEAIAAALPAGTLLVAHGLAVPAAVAVALRVPLAGLVLCNGPLRESRVTRALARGADSLVGHGLVRVLRPPLSTRLLASSFALRRLVVNPYVMDRDTVAALSDPIAGVPELRAAARAYLASLAVLPDPRGLPCPTLMAWGDADPVFPASEAAFLESVLPGSTYVRVPGGQHLHVEERPWALADTIRSWRRDQGPRA